jgi:ATP-binding cassette subfamily B (MDR/TAP) protein 1
VRFSYPTRPDFNALNSASLFFAAGEFTYVVGDSGSGKSTIGQLLLKLYDKHDGTITLDGKDIKTIDTKFIRGHILLVEQESTLFNAPIHENIYLGKQRDVNVTAQHIIEAVEFATMMDAIKKMPKGFDTMVGAKGTALSGGQRQRIALARAYIRNPDILVLDESTSALDYVNRVAVLNAIHKWRQNKTTIVITHDIAQILPREYVYVMKGGAVVEEGFRMALEENGGSHFCGFLKAAEKQEKRCVANGFEDQHPEAWAMVSEQDTHLGDVIDEYLDREDSLLSSLLIPTIFPKTTPSAGPGSMQLRSMVGPFARILPTPLSPVPDWASFRSESTESLAESRSDVLGSIVSLLIPKYAKAIVERQTCYAKRIVFQLFGRQVEDTQSLGESIRMNDVLSRPLNELAAHPKKKQSLETLDFTMLRIVATILPQLHGFKQRACLCIAFFSTIVYALSTPMFSYVFSKLLSTFYITDDRTHRAAVYSLEVLVVAIVDSVSIFVSSSLISRIGQIWCNNMRFRAMDRLLSQSRSFFEHEESGVSVLSECLDRHADEMQHILGRFLGVVLSAIVMLGVAIIWSLVSCWKLALVLLACSPIIWLAMVMMRSVSGEMDRRNLRAEEAASTILSESLINLKTIRILTLESRFLHKFQKANHRALKTSMLRAISCGPFFGLSESLLLFVNALIIYYGSVLIAAGEFELQSVLQTFVLLLFGVSNATMLASSIPQMSISQESAAKLLRLAYLPDNSHERLGKEKILGIDAIEFSNVTFSYQSRPEEIILQNLNLKISKGECIAIVGVSGSGKSTLASLLVDMYELTMGTIVMSGRSINEIYTPSLRSLVVLVPQTTIIVPGSVYSNICYGLPEFSSLRSRSNVRDAAAAAGAHDFVVGLSDGYDTMLGEGGTTLSGGQAQRIGLARALVRKPAVLVLDEVTSGLDAGAAAGVRKTVRKLRTEEGQQMTVVIITHSEEMMKLAERICVLEKGKMVEEGAWEDLMTKEDGVLRSLITTMESEGREGE